MKYQLPIIILSFIAFNAFSQNNFETGYYINNEGSVQECLIKNIDWRNNPKKFEYKLNRTSDPLKKSIESVQEFGILDHCKYIRKKVKLDRSSIDFHGISEFKEPELVEEEVFLKVLIEGAHNLYLHEEKAYKKFLFNVGSAEIVQLIYKKYLVDVNKIKENIHFKQQLLNSNDCTDISKIDIEELKYLQNDLVKHFIRLNKCHNTDFTDFEKNKNRNKFNLSLRPRINISSLNLENSVSNLLSTDVTNKLNFGLGLETEFIMPFNNSKWSIFLEPTFQLIKTSTTAAASSLITGQTITEVDYKSIEIPLGIRHYFHLSEASKIYLNVLHTFDLSFNSSVTFKRGDGSEIRSTDLKSFNNLGIGIGIDLKKKLNMEIRYQNGRTLTRNYVFYSSNFNTLSLVFGYKIITKKS